MQQSQRATWNHALEYAIRAANERGVPLVVAFGITRRFPEARKRHFAFMLEGLLDTADRLRQRGIRLVVRLSPPAQTALTLSADAALVVTDAGYLRIQRSWRRRVARSAGCRVVQVESDVVVPVGTASDKEEYAARTIRPKIHRALGRFLRPLEETRLVRSSLDLRVDGVEVLDLSGALDRLGMSQEAGTVV